MAAFLSFSRRKAYETAEHGHQQPIDPWNLGVSTSTSSVDSIAHQSSAGDTQLSAGTTISPHTPEGLRPRKSIYRIRKDILECYHHRHETDFRNNLSREFYKTTDVKLPPQHGSHFPSSLSHFGELSDSGIISSSLSGAGRSPLNMTSSFYEQSLEDNENWNNEDIDIISVVENKYFSQKHGHRLSRQQVAVSPDLKRGGKAKTAVGALVVAMDESSVGRNNPNERSRHSILPPRAWMDNHQHEDDYLIDSYTDEDDTIDCDGGDTDNQSSLHASPSSIRPRQKTTATYWIDRQAQFQQDTSFTQGILSNEHNSSWLEETATRDHSPYNFNSIMIEEGINASQREKIDAPRILSLVNDNGGLNVSAISHSQHQRDLETLYSLADTMEDEDDEYREIPLYYQALTDKHDVVNDDAFLMVKDIHQRRMKEDLLRSVFERLQDSLDLLNKVLNVQSSLFLGLRSKKGDGKHYRLLEDLLFELQNEDCHGSQRQAILFCLSLIQNTDSISDNTNPFSTYQSNHYWKPLPGFLSSLGLEEELHSPTVRGGDTSLFSLPSDSANDSTPHTSNVSMTTTITTVVSPEKETTQFFKQQQRSYYTSSDRDDDGDRFRTRRTVESLVNLVHRLESSCLNIESKMSAAGKLEVVEDIKKIYFELLIVPIQDLKLIINSYEIRFNQTPCLTRAVSDDQDVRISRSIHRPFPSYEKYKTAQQIEIDNQQHGHPETDILRVNIVHYDKNEDDKNQNQSIECDLWSPTTNDMNSACIEESVTAMRNGEYAAVIDEEEHMDNSRRTMRSFDNEIVQEEREAPPMGNEDLRENVDTATDDTRRVVAQQQQSRKNRFWKRKLSVLKNRGRQRACE
mmetsp:Transcript_44604/g.49752  ORF Transcript_44604/g.49752 Transcript_44604/m.49752 type:complete len:857 (+) Transcript_44604:252-2822(+)